MLNGLTRKQSIVKRTFDFTVSGLGLLLTCWIIAIAWLIAWFDTRESGFFMQERVGFLGKKFRTVKIRTMRPSLGISSNVTTSKDPRITSIGRFWRRTKIDELPQLFNVFVGQMSFVGPRPDVHGFADNLEGDDRIILLVRPGITGPATLKYRNEEELLGGVEDPETYNREVIFPDKVRLNKKYIEDWSFGKDISYIVKTVLGN